MNLRSCAALLVAGLILAGCFPLTAWVRLLPARPPAAALIGDPAHGELLFRTGVNEAPPCSTCHQVEKGGYGFSLGPNLQGIATRARARIAGMTAEQYLEDSILHPLHYVVSGFHVSMYADYAGHLSAQEVADLVAYLMTL